MKKLKYMILLLVLLAFTITGCTSTRHSAVNPQPVEIVVSAAASLKDALTEAGAAFMAENPNIIVRYNFAASGTLQRQIEQGAQVDVFISAADKNMDELAAAKLIDGASRRVLVRNELVLIMPEAGTAQVAAFADLANQTVKKVAVGETISVPAGQYSKDVLQHMGLWDAVAAKAVFAKDVRQVLTYVELGNVDAGLVYKTDAATTKKVKVMATAPPDTHAPINYPIAVVASTRHLEAAQAYSRYLTGVTAKDIFKKYGFTTID